MSKNVSHIQHVKSSVVENGQPKLPTASVIVEGEIAVNYADGFETLSIKTSSGNIATFSSDNYYTEKKLGSGFTGENSANTVTSVIEDNERAISAALNDLEANKLDVSAYTPTDLSNYYTKSETSGKTELSDAFDEKADITWVEDKLGSGFTGENSANTVTSVIEENEEIVSTALNDLDTKKLDVSAYTPTDLSNYYTKSETSGKTEISTELNKYADSVKYNSTSHAIEFYHGTTAGTKVFEVDASAFIIDGMVDDVEVADIESGSTTVKCLVVTFNTDAGKQDINIPLSDIFNPNLYYTKDEIDDSELVISSALNDLETNKLDVSAYTPTDLSNYYTKSETSGKTELSDAFDEKADIDWVEDKLGSGFTGENSANTVTSVIRDNELIISAALNDLEASKLDASAYTPTDLSNYYTKSQTSSATEISDAFIEAEEQIEREHTTIAAALNDLNDRISSAARESDLDEIVDALNDLIDNVKDKSKTVSAALNDLEDNKLDVSAYTPTDLSNYYTKSETSGATELSDAFDEKADIDWVEDKLGSGFTGENSANTVTSVIEENEEIVSTALNDLETKKLDVSAYTPTDLSNYYTKSETSGKTEISTALSEKENTLSIDSTAKTASFSAEVGKYYIVNVPNNGSVTVTLPTTNMSSTNVQSIVFLVTLGSGTASIAFTPIAFVTEGFNDMEASNTYEVNALWNGTNWIMAMTKLEAVV